VGAAVSAGHAGADGLTTRADQAMYAAKQGRDGAG
jgi:GGDEF domain-containing protein